MVVLMKMHSNKELRKAPPALLDHIAIILDINDDWKKVMSKIPKDLHSDHFEPKYNSEHIRLIEQYAHTTKLRCAKVLFDEWGTSGRIRPTLRTLMDILAKTQMFRAAEYLANMLNEDPPIRPQVGPGAPINVTDYLNNITSEQNIETRKLSDNSNGNTNETYDELCDHPTIKLESGPTPAEVVSAPNLMEFPSTQGMLPDFEALGNHFTAMMSNRNNVTSEKNLIDFSKASVCTVPIPEEVSDQYKPDFSALLPRGEIDNSSLSTMSAASTAVSETSQSVSDFTAQSENSQSQLGTPSLGGVSLYEQLDSEIIEDTNLIKFKYSDLQAIMRNIADSHIGSGGFGDVFVGDHKTYGLLAIKRAHSLHVNHTSYDIMKIFNTEVKTLSLLRHENIVPILGYSLDGPAPCIVCKYIEGGSLLENIATKNLTEHERMKIMIGTAEGLKYTHNTVKPSSLVSGIQTSSRKAYFMHGDVKSANILISKGCIPMLCDFGLSKQCATTFHTESIMGTSAYMAPERFSGTITQKGDIFSYGIVLLELLTGLEPIVTKDDETLNIKTYVEEKCLDGNIIPVLDSPIEGWSKAQKIFELAKLCMKKNKNKRPTMDVICETLHQINENEQRVFYADV